MVEYHLAKVAVAGSNPVERSTSTHTTTMKAATKLYTATVLWPVLKSNQLESFTDRTSLIKFLSFFDKYPKSDEPLFKIAVYETDVYYFTNSEMWHVMSPKELDMNLLWDEAAALNKPAIVTDATLELKPGEEITK